MTTKAEDVIARISDHMKWFHTKRGVKAVFDGEDLSGAVFENVNLSCASFVKTNLSNARFINVRIGDANFRDAFLAGAIFIDCTITNTRFTNACLNGARAHQTIIDHCGLSHADLKGFVCRCSAMWCCDLQHVEAVGALFTEVDLTGSSLFRADLTDVVFDTCNLQRTNIEQVDISGVCGLPHVRCPEEGSFIAYKYAVTKDGPVVVKLQIPEDALGSSATTSKCRCSKAKVLSFTNIDGTPSDVTICYSVYDTMFEYRVGETITVDNFCTDRWKECASGIHFYLSRDEAVLKGQEVWEYNCRDITVRLMKDRAIREEIYDGNKGGFRR